MIVTWMLAAMFFALLLGVAAHATEAAARLFARQGRAPWAAALAASLVWPPLLPLIRRLKIMRLPPLVIDGGAVHSIAARLQSVPPHIASRVDAIAIAAWVFVSAFLLLRLVRAQRALLLISRDSRATTIDGHDVFVTSDIGPAVVGISAPRVAVPLWLTELDAPLRDLVLRHEREHCRSRDTLLVWLGELSVALMPWNPAVWWQARRLRLALELDCDARTLRSSGAVETYGKLLLLIAERQRMTRLAPMLAESNSHLGRRITAMTRQSASHRPLRAAVLGVVTIVAIIAACSERVGSDLTGPTQTAGRFVSKQSAKAAIITRDNAYQEYQVEQPASFAQASGHPHYPEILKKTGVEGEVIASFVIDTMGVPDVSTTKIIKSTHQLFENSVVAAIPTMKFVPALVGGMKVRQVVMLPFMFSIADSTKSKYIMLPDTLVGRAIMRAPSRP
jgi:TonB family protein